MMLKRFTGLTEYKILAILGIIFLSWQLLTIFGSFLSMFTDIFLLMILSWILAFMIEPIVNKLTYRRIPKILAAAIVYLVITAAAIFFVIAILPTIVTQLSELTSLIPVYLPRTSPLTPRVENFLSVAANSSFAFASGIASAAANVLFVFILSFYILMSRAEISKLISSLIPDKYEPTYSALEKTFNETFASFLRVQVSLGLILGLVVYITLLVLNINFAISSALLSSVFAMVPVIGPFLFLIPVVLAALSVSLDKLFIAIIICAIAAQIVYNIVSPKLLGSALKIHPIIILLSFLFGYRIGGLWGAIFSIPVISSFAIVGQGLLTKQTADK